MEESIEQRIANDIMISVRRLHLPLKLDELTEGKGDCFPLAVLAQCRRTGVFRDLNDYVKSIINENDPTVLRIALKKFMITSSEDAVRKLKSNYEEILAPIDGLSWNKYWDSMSNTYTWVDHPFIQGMAWFINHDIMITTTTSSKDRPYVKISGNLLNESIPCGGTPLILGCKSDIHFQSLIPITEPLRTFELNTTELMKKKSKSEPFKAAKENKDVIKIAHKFGEEDKIVQSSLKYSSPQDMQSKERIKARTHINEETQNVGTFCYQNSNKCLRFQIKDTGFVSCAFCKISFKSIVQHLKRSHCMVEDIEKFKGKLLEFTSKLFVEEKRKATKERQLKYENIAKSKNMIQWKENQKNRKAKSDAQLRLLNNDKVKMDQLERRKRCDAKLRELDDDKVKRDQIKRKIRSDNKLRKEDNDKVKRDQVERKTRSDAQFRRIDNNKVKRDQIERKIRSDNKLRTEDNDKVKWDQVE